MDVNMVKKNLFDQSPEETAFSLFEVINTYPDYGSSWEYKKSPEPLESDEF